MPRILFLHGLRGSPQGLKVQRLQSVYGVQNVQAPSLGYGRRADGRSRAVDLVGAARLLFDGHARAMRIADATYETFQPDVVVGASLGGGLALRLESGLTPLVLVAPAWKKSTLVRATGSATRQMLPWPLNALTSGLATWLAQRNFPEDMPRVKPGTQILHAPTDEVIPLADSRELLASGGLPNANLIEVGVDHTMNGEPELTALLDAVARCLVAADLQI